MSEKAMEMCERCGWLHQQCTCDKQLLTEIKQLRADLTEIANIVHHGGLIGFTDECSAQNEIRRITFQYWDMSAAEKLQRGGR